MNNNNQQKHTQTYNLYITIKWREMRVIIYVKTINYHHFELNMTLFISDCYDGIYFSEFIQYC